jgi:hypothetical protein
MNNSIHRVKLLNKKKLEDKINEETNQESNVEINQEPKQENEQENKIIVNENIKSLEEKLKILPQHLVPQIMELLNKIKNQ